MNNPDNLFEKVIKREKIYKGKYLDLEKCFIELPDGKEGIREIVCVKNAVAVLPIDENRDVFLVRQHRAAIGRTILEIPAGLIDEGEEPEDSAIRECEEEIGFRPGKLTELLTYSHAEGYSTGFITLYLGTDLKFTGRTFLDNSEFLEIVKMPYDLLVEDIARNRFVDSKTILSVMLSREITNRR